MKRRALKVHWMGSRKFAGCDVARQPGFHRKVIYARELTSAPRFVTCRICIHHMTNRGMLPMPTPKPRKVSFKVTKADAVLIAIAAQRAHNIARASSMAVDYPVLDVEMDITACHANGCKLDLKALLAASDGNFGHDVFGIRRHLDRRDGVPTAGRLLDYFVPRFRALTKRDKERMRPAPKTLAHIGGYKGAAT